MKTKFIPIHPEYYNMFSKEQEKDFSKVFYFGTGRDVKRSKVKFQFMK